MTVDRDWLWRRHQGPARHAERAALLRRARPRTPATTETVVQVETTIDDMSPQLYEPLMERLFEAGALDVFLTPVIMKRSRPGTVLTALCAAATQVGDLSRVLFEESSTIGVRWTEVSRARLDREMVTHRHRLRAAAVQGLPARRPYRDGHAGVRRRRPHRPGEIASRSARSSRPAPPLAAT